MSRITAALCLPLAFGVLTVNWAAHAQPAEGGTQPEKAAKIIVKKELVYGKVHGAALLADLAYPEGKGPFPVILSVHGGRWVGGHRTSAPSSTWSSGPGSDTSP